MATLAPAPPLGTDAQADAAAFRALADPTRLRILAHLREVRSGCCPPDSEVCACDLEAVTGLTQPTVSHHMKCLVEAGLVHAEKRGRWTYYRVRGDAVNALQERLAWLGGG